MKILVVTAHPDDLENGMGGTLTLLAREGHKIASIIATLPMNELGLSGGVRRMESIASHALLNMAPPLFLEQPDGKLEDSATTRSAVKIAIETEKPDVIFTLWPADVHPDHRAIASLTLGAALQRGVNTELFCFEVCASGRASTSFRPQTLGFFPTHYVDTTDVQEEKYALMNCHKTQDPDGMWLGMQNVHSNRGVESGHDFAEGFLRLTRHGELHPELTRLFAPTRHSLPRGIGVDFEKSAIGL